MQKIRRTSLYLHRETIAIPMKTAIVAIIILLAGVLCMSFRVLLVKSGRFPGHHHSAALRAKGVNCASHQSSNSNHSSNS